MLFVVIGVGLVVVGWILRRKLIQYRWRQMQIKRQRDFQRYPYCVKDSGQFALGLTLSHAKQKQLIDTFGWNNTEQSFLKKVYLYDVTQHLQQPQVKVILGAVDLGNLSSHYAQQLRQALQQTDFVLGRPIVVLADIQVSTQEQKIAICRVSLDLPLSAADLTDLLQ